MATHDQLTAYRDNPAKVREADPCPRERIHYTGPIVPPPASTCIEHAYGSAFRLSFQIKVF